METLNYKNLLINSWDLRDDSTRPLWRHYYRNTQGIIFVVDSSDDRNRFIQAKDELNRLLGEDNLRNAVLLVFANGQDLSTATSRAEIKGLLSLNELTNRQWSIHEVLEDGLVSAIL